MNYYFLVFIIGLIIGTIIERSTISDKYKNMYLFGTLKINTKDPKRDVFNMSIETEDVEELAKHEAVVLKIVSDVDSRK